MEGVQLKYCRLQEFHFPDENTSPKYVICNEGKQKKLVDRISSKKNCIKPFTNPDKCSIWPDLKPMAYKNFNRQAI